MTSERHVPASGDERQPAPIEPVGTLAHGWSILLWVAAYLCIAGMIQLFIPYPMDADTAYHAAVGRLIREHGILHSFPWTPFSILADRYADKELLFHVFFAALAGIEWTSAARIVGTVAGASVLTALFFVFRAERVRYAGLWALVPLAASHSFIYRFAVVRPYVLSIALAVMVLWSAVRGRLWLLFVVSALYPWTYVAWHLPLILVGIAEVGRLISGHPLRWKPSLAALGGITVGVALHPNGYNLVQLTWVQIVQVLLRNAWGGKEYLELGKEFLPETLQGWMTGLAVCAVMVLGALYLAWRERKHDTVALAFALAAIAFAFLTMKSGRFIEYFVPLSAAALALAARTIRFRHLPQVVVALSCLYTIMLNADYLLAFSRSPNLMPPAAASFLQERIPEGAQVFTTDWAPTGTLMLALPERRFIVGLDPTFFLEKNPELYRLWYRIPREALPDSAGLIRRRFGARYVISGYREEWRPFFEQLLAEPGVTMHEVNDFFILFDLGDQGHPERWSGR